ncbi:hypothetical protein [Streptomyces sp. NPDC048242]
MLKQLEAAGVVTRQRSPHDERQVLIRLAAVIGDTVPQVGEGESTRE